MERVLACARRSARRAGAGLLIALSFLPLAAGCSADEGELELNAAASTRALQVINLSLGDDPTLNLPCSDPRYSALRDALAFAAGRNVTVVAAAGNFSRDFANTVPRAIHQNPARRSGS